MKLAILAIVLLAYSKGIYSLPHENDDELQDSPPDSVPLNLQESLKNQESDNIDSETEKFKETTESDVYIVVFKEEATTKDVESHKESVKTMSRIGPIKHEYDFGQDFRGYAAPMTKEKAVEMENDPVVKYVEKSIDRYIDRACTSRKCHSPWGLVRSSKRHYKPSDTCYIYSKTGKGVKVYILDTGIDTKNPEFGGRAHWGFAFDGKYIDDVGHGTHVTGTVISNSYGIAKRATAISVRICHSDPRGGVCSDSAIIAGLNYVARQHRPGAKSVINMSLGGSGPAVAMESALKATISKGVHVSVAAGNGGEDACRITPARVPQVVTVSAIDQEDMAYFNYGRCVDISAPGVDVLSTLPGGKTIRWSGTSMATPHVTGAIAVILQKYNLTPAQMQARLKLVSTKDQIKDLMSGTSNSILFIPCY